MADFAATATAANKSYAATFAHPNLPFGPSRHCTVLTCLDGRLDPQAALGIELGTVAIIRNAGGSAKAALRDLIVCTQIIGGTTVILLRHTDCGLTKATDEQAVGLVESKTGAKIGDQVHFYCYPASQVEQQLRDDVEWIKKQPLLPKDTPILGAIYRIEDGTVKWLDV